MCIRSAPILTVLCLIKIILFVLVYTTLVQCYDYATLDELTLRVCAVRDAGAGCHAFVLGAFNHYVALIAHSCIGGGVRFVLLDSENNTYTSLANQKERQLAIQALMATFSNTHEKSLPCKLLLRACLSHQASRA